MSHTLQDFRPHGQTAENGRLKSKYCIIGEITRHFYSNVFLLNILFCLGVFSDPTPSYVYSRILLLH